MRSGKTKKTGGTMEIYPLAVGTVPRDIDLGVVGKPKPKNLLGPQRLVPPKPSSKKVVQVMFPSPEWIGWRRTKPFTNPAVVEESTSQYFDQVRGSLVV